MIGRSGTDLAICAAAGYVVSITAPGGGAGAGRLRVGVGRHSCFRLLEVLGWRCFFGPGFEEVVGVWEGGSKEDGGGGERGGFMSHCGIVLVVPCVDVG